MKTIYRSVHKNLNNHYEYKINYELHGSIINRIKTQKLNSVNRQEEVIYQGHYNIRIKLLKISG